MVGGAGWPLKVANRMDSPRKGLRPAGLQLPPETLGPSLSFPSPLLPVAACWWVEWGCPPPCGCAWTLVLVWSWVAVQKNPAFPSGFAC